MLSHLTITGHAEQNRIKVIKGIRAITGWGLTEAKEAAELTERGGRVDLPLAPRLSLHDAEGIAGVHGILYILPGRRQRLWARVKGLGRPSLPEWAWNIRINFWRAMPVYVTRTNAHHETGTITIGAGLVLIVSYLIWINVFLWSIAGIVLAIRVLT